MKALIENFTTQLQEALAIGKKSKYTFPEVTFGEVVVSGLGGSGIGASIVQEYVYDKLDVPFLVNKNYFIPKFVNARTLFIACSYSGNTEETLQAVESARKAKAVIVCVSSGGELSVFAKTNNYPLIEIPGGLQPRACLGYSLVQLLFILKKAKLLRTAFEKEIADAIVRINKDTKAMQKKALSVASCLVDKQVAIYTTAGKEGLAVRFKQQLNENAKILGWSNVIPEMTHNEIVGWRAANKDVAVIFCYHALDFPKNLKRLKVLKKIVKKYNPDVSEISIKGESYLEQAFYFIHLTDWVSFHLSSLNGHDPIEVKVIDYLKSEMAKK
jgi:glucose/mannose-6-phosphate isomerase